MTKCILHKTNTKDITFGRNNTERSDITEKFTCAVFVYIESKIRKIYISHQYKIKLKQI